MSPTDPLAVQALASLDKPKHFHPRGEGQTSGKSELEATLELHLRYSEHPRAKHFVREFKFHETRKWRFDFCWLTEKLAIEVQGGIWVSGKHGRGAGIEAGFEKLNEAQILGWKVLQVSPGQIRSGAALRWVEQALR